MSLLPKRFSFVLSLAVFFCGCAEQKKPVAAVTPAVQSAPVEVEHSQTPVTLIPTGDSPTADPSPPLSGTSTDSVPKAESSAASENAAPPVAESKPESRPTVAPFPEGAWLPKDVVGLIVLHPRRLLETPMGKILQDSGIDRELAGSYELQQKLHISLREIERATLVIDQSHMNTIARENGWPVVNANAPEAGGNRRELQNVMKQLGLAFHLYYDTFRRFPRADGDGQGTKNGLSWRVHLLPYLGEQQLFDEFHLDESWDSEHNKALIARMPRIYSTPGVTEEGKTAFHVFAGEGTLFQGELGFDLRSVTDGTSNTLLAVIAGTDTAEIWTKPGGLDVDPQSPRKSLGDLQGQPFFTVFADGFVRELPVDIDERLLAAMINPADGIAIDVGAMGPNGQAVLAADAIQSGPTLIVTLTRDIDVNDVAEAVLGQTTAGLHEGQTIHKKEFMAIWSPDQRTIVAGPIRSVQNVITAKQSNTGGENRLVSELKLDAELSAAFDLESQSVLITHLAQMQAMLGMISNIKTASARFSAASPPGSPLVEFVATSFNEDLSNGLAAVATVGLTQAKAMVSQLPETPNATAAEKEIQNVFKGLITDAVVTQEGAKVSFTVPRPKGLDRIVSLLKPALISIRGSAELTRRKNALKLVALAFHNYHDAYRTFPGAGRGRAEGSVGLSWRVHLLPFLGQSGLYSQFKLDEAWDSDHNKELIEKMPSLFQSPGVVEEGKTSLHVFTGPGAIFADDKVTKISEITDGTSNTILVVQAGPETAEIWTRPGGLDFDPNDPIQALGNLAAETFMVLFADGAIRTLPKEIDPQTLRRYIQMTDGEVP